MRNMTAALVGLTIFIGAAGAAAEPASLDVVLSPADQIRLEFEDDDRHSLSLTQRDGTAEGSGVFAGAKVIEYGMHDVTVGEGGHATGYLAATATGGDVAYFQWRLRAQFVAGADGKARVVNHGHWELAGGTGQFASMRGVGTIRIEFVNKTDRRFVLEGDISPAL